MPTTDAQTDFAARVAEAEAAIRADFTAAGKALPADHIVRRAADTVASYPQAWRQYDAHPNDWDGRLAVALLWAWGQLVLAGAAQAEAA